MNDYGLVYEDEELKNSLTPGNSQQLQAPAEPPPLAPQPVPSLPTTPAHQVTKPHQLPGMPQGIGPDDLSPYINQQKTAMSKYGPDQQMAVEKSLMDQRNSLGYKVADAGKGFADALMQGVARAGNPGWQQQFENQNMAQGEQQLQTMQKANEGQIQKTQAGMSLDAMNPTSPLSKAAQQSFAPILAKLGISPTEIPKMAASQMANIAELGVKYADVEVQNELKMMGLRLQEMMGRSGIENQKAERRIAGAKGEAGLGVIGGLIHPEAKKAFKAEMDGDATPAPHGQTVKQNGKTYTWNGSQYVE